MYRCVTKVKPTDDFQLMLEFDGGEMRIFDVKPIFSYGRFAELQDKKAFRRVHTSFDTVEWDNGLDLDPEYLYSQSREMGWPHVIKHDLSEGYRDMAADSVRESEALEWAEATCGDTSHEES